jgi:hypothetical protein
MPQPDHSRPNRHCLKPNAYYINDGNEQDQGLQNMAIWHDSGTAINRQCRQKTNYQWNARFQ